MAAASIMNSLPNEISPPLVSDILLADHRDCICLIRHFRKAAEANDTLLMEKLTDAIALVIRLHSQAEMDVLYPFMSTTLGKRKSHVGECLDEHTEIEKDVLKALGERKEGGDKLKSNIDKDFEDFEKHMSHEENEWLLPLLEKASDEELIKVSTEFMEAKQTAPLEPQA